MAKESRQAVPFDPFDPFRPFRPPEWTVLQYGHMMLKVSLSLLVLIAPMMAAEFKSEKECVVGSRVADRENHAGKVVSVESAKCRVLLDSSGQTTTYLFWMLHAAGASAETNDNLVMGKYNCWVGSQATGGLRITGPSSYESDGKAGKYRVEPSRKIVFESGPFSTFTAKLLPGPKIGLNMTGGSFYNMTCDPAK